MFTVKQIEDAHKKVQSGADFPKYIQEIATIGVTYFVTWVKDSHTEYFGANNFVTKSATKYNDLIIAEISDKEKFVIQLKEHQKGDTDYFQFCNDCATSGIEKWVVNLNEMTCIYFDKNGNDILIEQIPQI
jgi:uncharacterized protein YbcV (DUF1398 family)